MVVPGSGIVVKEMDEVVIGQVLSGTSVVVTGVERVVPSASDDDAPNVDVDVGIGSWVIPVPGSIVLVDGGSFDVSLVPVPCSLAEVVPGSWFVAPSGEGSGVGSGVGS